MFNKQKEITEKGQLSRTKEYQKRIEEYQKLHGITIDKKEEEEKKIELAPGFQMPNKDSKYYKKKLYRKKKKMKEKQALLEAQKPQQEQNGEHHENVHPEEIPNGKTEDPSQNQEPQQSIEQDKYLNFSPVHK